MQINHTINELLSGEGEKSSTLFFMGIAEKSMIQVLDRQLVDLIAAGEVIDSPLAVVRELVENALDAGADRILVRVWWDQWRLEVLDNGQGMDVTELKTSVLPHATSKISK